MSNTVEFTLYGEDARKLAKRLGLKRNGDSYGTENVYVDVALKFIKGRTKLTVELDFE